MKIIPLAGFILFTNIHLAFCPNNYVLTIPKGEVIVSTQTLSSVYDPLIDAIYLYESTRNPMAYHLEKDGLPSVGGLQIRQCRVDEYNRLTGSKYTLEDMYDLNNSIKVFLYYTNHDHCGNEIPSKSFEQTAKDWNGGGPATEVYWERVSSILNT